MKYIQTITILLLLVLATGCINDDMSECERTYLYFSYKGDGVTQIFNQKIGKVNLYVFDSENHLVDTKLIDQNELITRQSTRIKLEPGDYRIVCIGNPYDDTRISDPQAGNMGNILFAHPGYYDNTAINTNDSLYLGSKIINVPETYWVRDTIPFESSHVKMTVEVRGLGPAANGGPSATLVVNNLYPYTDFANSAGGELCSYYPTMTYNESRLNMTAGFNIFRIDKENPVTIDLVYPSGEILHSLRLEDFLIANPSIDVTKNEVLIPILIKFSSVGVIVTIPDWYIEELYPIL